MSELQQRIDFIKALDALKEVQRKTYLISQKRYENSAEHSWAVATFALVLADYAPAGTDMQRVMEMLLLHDVVEVYAGDTLLYDESANASKQERELKAASQLFGMLPAPQSEKFHSLWHEFERGESQESMFANGLDRMIPIIHNLHTGGRAWRELGVRYDQIIAKNTKIAKANPELWDYIKAQIDEIFDGNQTLDIAD